MSSPIHRAARTFPIVTLFLAAAGASGLLLYRQHFPRRYRQTIGLQRDWSFLVPTNQRLTPIGTVRKLEGTRPKDLALSPDGKTLAVLCMDRIAFYSAEGSRLQEVPAISSCMGIAWAPNGTSLYASGNGIGVMHLELEGGRWQHRESLQVDVEAPSGLTRLQRRSPELTGLAVSPNGERLYAAMGIRNAVAVVDLTHLRVVKTLHVGVAPGHVLLSPDGSVLYVANRGGRHPGLGQRSAGTADTPVRIDPRTDAAVGGSISIIDTARLSVHEMEVGTHPGAMALSPDGSRLYVPLEGSDRVEVLEVHHGRRSGLNLTPPNEFHGQIPTACALSDDGESLYTACGGGNFISVRDSLSSSPPTTLPTGWFPIAIAQRAGMLYVASSKGFGARPVYPPRGYGVHNSVGMVQFIPLKFPWDAARLNRQVAFNNRVHVHPTARADMAPVPIPERVGEPSVFKHVVYIIKENHTYDEDLGDMPQGNGRSALTLFGEEITPNEHALAREFVLLDNTYTSGTNSADGHQWVDSSIASGYMEQNHGVDTRSYPYDGGDALAYSSRGFLWNAVQRKQLSQRVYGEFVNRPKIVDSHGTHPTWSQMWQDYTRGRGRYHVTAGTDCAALRPFLRPGYIGWPIVMSDQQRASIFLKDLGKWEADGFMPSFCLMLLPNNHTEGTSKLFPTPRAMVADNDLALGRIVEGISLSRFWKETLVLVIEDDSQMALDHVDGHRTVAFCISPYTRRGSVVSHMYNHTSFARTIELVLGLPPMTRFDRSATPLTACFTRVPDARPYAHRANRVPLDEMNPPVSALRGEARRLAESCNRLDWSGMDRADTRVLTRAAWQAGKPGCQFPAAHFHPDADD